MDCGRGDGRSLGSPHTHNDTISGIYKPPSKTRSLALFQPPEIIKESLLGVKKVRSRCVKGRSRTVSHGHTSPYGYLYRGVLEVSVVGSLPAFPGRWGKGLGEGEGV